MSAVTISRPSAVDRLVAGVSRISVRHSSDGQARYRKPQPEKTGYPEGHGEKLWVFSNVREKQISYSHTAVLNVHKTAKQIPFTAKKAKPSKIRKDLWRQVAMVQFPAGKGEVGQSVFSKLREFHNRHLYEWGDEMLYGETVADDGTSKKVLLKRKDRGKKILEQKDNAIADLAAVLSGVGKSNKINGKDELCEATVYWANGIDRHYAEKWSENVKHGLLPNGVDWSAEHGSLAPTKAYTLLPEKKTRAKVTA